MVRILWLAKKSKTKNYESVQVISFSLICILWYVVITAEKYFNTKFFNSSLYLYRIQWHAPECGGILISNNCVCAGVKLQGNWRKLWYSNYRNLRNLRRNYLQVSCLHNIFAKSEKWWTQIIFSYSANKSCQYHEQGQRIQIRTHWRKLK